MRITASHLGNFVLTLLLFFVLISLAQNSFAADAEEVINDGRVEVVYPAEATAAYKDRKQNKSIIFGVTVDQINLTRFRSKIDGADYLNLFGSSPVNVVQGELGLKYNFPIGALGASVIYGGGEVSDGRSGLFSTLVLGKKGLSGTFTMDSLFREPYIVPYITGQILIWDWSEKAGIGNGSKTKSGSTAVSSGFQGGVLIQLNWIDPTSALVAQNESGMDNAYLDFFVSQYNSSTGTEDPNFQTDLNYGAGMKLEF